MTTGKGCTDVTNTLLNIPMPLRVNAYGSVLIFDRFFVVAICDRKNVHNGVGSAVHFVEISKFFPGKYVEISKFSILRRSSAISYLSDSIRKERIHKIDAVVASLEGLIPI